MLFSVFLCPTLSMRDALCTMHYLIFILVQKGAHHTHARHKRFSIFIQPARYNITQLTRKYHEVCGTWSGLVWPTVSWSGYRQEKGDHLSCVRTDLERTEVSYEVTLLLWRVLIIVYQNLIINSPIKGSLDSLLQ